MQFLKTLLDSQLNTLVNNIKYMQNDNGHIELETIKRLQLVEQFGIDANNGLNEANNQKVHIKEDIQQENARHEKLLVEQETEQRVLQGELSNLEQELSRLRTRFENGHSDHTENVMSK